MFSGRHAALAFCPAAALLVACGTASTGGSVNQTQTLAPSRVARAPVTATSEAHSAKSAPPRAIARAIAVAKRIYGNEINGSRAHSDIRLIASDQALVGDLSRGELAAAHSEAFFQMTSHRGEHITRVSVRRGRRVLINAVWNGNGTFVVAPLAQGLDVNGRRLTLLVSVQDVVGYVKLAHIYTGAQVVVRGASGQVRTSLPAAAHAPLPSSGHVTISGRRYVAGSFHLGGWDGESLTVWVLEPA